MLTKGKLADPDKGIRCYCAQCVFGRDVVEQGIYQGFTAPISHEVDRVFQPAFNILAGRVLQ